MSIRPARDADSGALIHLIASVYSEYEGCVLDVENECRALLAPATWFRDSGGCLWVFDDDGVAGSCGFVPSPAGGGAELLKLYVSRARRRQGIGRLLLAHALGEARRRGARFCELWTDTRFVEGHRFYESEGFTRSPGTRALNDRSRSIEYHYRRNLE